MVLGNIIRSSLENLHFNKKPIGNEVSRLAFHEYVKFLDYGKQFLIQSDVETLGKYKTKIDDQITFGDLKILKDGERLLTMRVKEIQKYVRSRLEQPFNLETKKVFELDGKKRSRPKGTKELYALWNKILTRDIISNYLDLEEEQKERVEKKKALKKTDKTDKKSREKKSKKSVKYDKREKKAPRRTPAQVREEALKRTSKKYLRVFERMLKEDQNDRLNKLFNAIGKIFDPHTQYLPPRAKEDFNISMSGSLEGIGAILREDGNYIKVLEIVPGSASWRGKKLKAEDVILKVGQGSEEPVDIVGMRVEDAVQLIRGKKGTEVRLTVKHGDGSQEVVPIVRDVVVIEESYVKSSVIQKQGSKRRFGYIQVPTFYRDFSKRLGDKTARNCTTDVLNALKSLKKLKVSGVVLDLRNNGGGSLEDARMMSGLFIRKGPIVQVKNYEGKTEVLDDRDPRVSYRGPLVVLTNKFSASASEILASAMQDYGRGVIVGGEVTHGKGTVQTLLDLDRYVNPQRVKLKSPLGSMKLTIQKFYRVTGGSTQFKGVVPDIILPDPLGYLKSGERHHDYPLSWDQVKPLAFSKWKNPADLPTLKRESQERVKNNKKFQNIVQSVTLLKNLRDDTQVKISLKGARKRRADRRKDRERLKFDEVNESVVVSNVNVNRKLADKERKERIKEWSDGLQKDPYIEETLEILEDMSS